MCKVILMNFQLMLIRSLTCKHKLVLLIGNSQSAIIHLLRISCKKVMRLLDNVGHLNFKGGLYQADVSLVPCKTQGWMTVVIQVTSS